MSDNVWPGVFRRWGPAWLGSVIGVLVANEVVCLLLVFGPTWARAAAAVLLGIKLSASRLRWLVDE